MSSSPPIDAPSSEGGAVSYDQAAVYHRSRRVAQGLGWTTALIGALVLVGWVVAVPLLRSWLPGQVEAKANTALCLLLAGLALAWKTPRSAGDHPNRLRLANFFAGFVALVGLVTVGQYLFGLDLGVDQLLFRDVSGAAFTVHAGRMALPTACNFMLMGWALLLVRPGHDSRAAVWLCVPVAVLAGLAFIGQLYNLPWLTSLGPFTQIALPTGVSFLALSAGTLLIGSSRLGPWLRRSGQVAGLVCGFVLLLTLSGAVARNTTAQIENTAFVTHTYEVLDRLGLTLAALQDVETAARGFVLTGDEAFLGPYRTAPAQLARLQVELRELTRDNVVQQRRLFGLQTLVDRKLAAAEEQIKLRESGDVAGARDLVAGGRGRLAMDAVRVAISELRAEEEKLLRERARRLEASTHRTLITLVIGLGSAFLLLVTSFRLLRREIVQRTKIGAALERSEKSLSITLNSIGDGVLATDTQGRITLLNPIAEQLTGWTLAEAKGRPVGEVFHIIHENTRAPAQIPVEAVLASGEIMGLENHTALIARDGTERSIADSAAPIRDRAGAILGVVLVFRDVTEAQRARIELDRFFSLSVDFLCIASLDGFFKRASPAVADILGWTVEEFLARPYKDQIHPDDWPASERVIGTLAAGEKLLNFENRFQHKDGGWRVLSWRVVPQMPEGLLYCSARDVTERKRTEEALRKSSAEIYDLYNRAPCGYHSLDAGGRVVAMNETELEWLGYAWDEVVGRMTVADLVAAESQPVLRDHLARLRVESEISGLELKLARKDGTTFPVLLNATALRDVSGNYVSCRATVFDITKRKQAEAELDQFFTLSVDFLCISSVDGYFKRVSPGVTGMLGWTPEEFMAKPYVELVHPDDQAATLNEVQRQMATGSKVLNFENRYHHKDGSWRLLSWRSVPEPSSGLMYATARDVTESRKKEDEIRRLHSDLQRHSAQLEVANKELEAFSYSVSHDLRAPLRHIHGYVEMLAREMEPHLTEKSRRYLKTVSDAGREMGTLIDDLLAFSRMGRAEMAEREVNMGKLVDDVRKGLELSLEGREIRWTVAPLPPVRGDEAMLRQVLANLVGNAVKYTRGRPVAEIQIGHGPVEQGMITFFIRDNGAGFDMKYAGKLFGVFQRLHRADEFEGTGIGLANVRRIVARHGGRTWAEGQLGAGATFYFTLRPALAPVAEPTPVPV